MFYGHELEARDSGGKNYKFNFNMSNLVFLYGHELEIRAIADEIYLSDRATMIKKNN